jgi:FkbM family methyltransferase
MSMISCIPRIIGTALSWRIGRALYLAARGEGANDMNTNGERLVVERVATLLARSKGTGHKPVFIDCGANLGEWTEMARQACAAVGITPEFHLLEPAPAAYEVLARRFSGLPDVLLHPVALSDSDGNADFFIIAPTGGRNSLVDSEHSQADRTRVRVVRGAPYFGALGIERIDLLKIDTEGNDYAVLEGFAEMLREHRIGVVQFEYNFRWLAVRRSMRDVFELAKCHGYRVCKPDGSRIIVYRNWNAELDRFFEWNYLLVPEDRLPLLDVCESHWCGRNTLVARPKL